jgi:hypothetical protein
MIKYLHKYQTFLSNITKQIDKHVFNEANKSLISCKAMKEELQALKKNITWDVVKLPNEKKS